MTFAINAVADSPNNFGAFQELAKHLNGTNASTTSSSAPSPSSPGTGAASRKEVAGVGIGLLAAFLAAVVL